jgi:hypothetical protein
VYAFGHRQQHRHALGGSEPRAVFKEVDFVNVAGFYSPYGSIAFRIRLR